MMKKTMLMALLAASQFGFGQQRFVVTEEFTQASCPPCASLNPAFNTLLQANTTKTFGLKYQTSWPGYDPMNEHNPTQVQDRVNYYSVSGVPNAIMDGNVYQGTPSGFTQSGLDARYATNSPLEITLSHSVMPTLDSIQITATIKNISGSTLNSGSAGSMKLHVVVAEEEIIFTTPPGSTNEKDFYGVMKSMVTGGSGFSLPDSWAANATNTYTYKVAMPIYTYLTKEIGIVAFVQEDSNKEILQGAYSTPQADPSNTIDVELSDATGTPPGGYCVTSVDPKVNITNNSGVALTSLNLYYSVNGGPATKVAWTGNIPAGGSTVYTMPTVALNGPTSVNIFSYVPNNTGDPEPINNYFTATFQVLNPTPLPNPVNYDFESDAIGTSPSDMIDASTSGRAFIVTKAINSGLTANLGGMAVSETSLRFDFFSIQAGVQDEFITSKVDLSNVTNSKIFFDHAYAQWSSENDKLEIFVSDDCGASWTSVWTKSGANLATHPPVGGQNRFYPQDPSHWMRNTVDISAFDGKEVIVRIMTTSDFGNCLYVDNINVSDSEISAISVEENALENIKIYPNPSNGIVNVDMALDFSSEAAVSVMNNLGQVVYTANETTNGKLSLDLSNLATGVYTVKITVDGKVATERISLVK